MPWLLDTNVWIDFLKNPFPGGAIADRLRVVPQDELATCTVVKAELLHGALKYGNPQRRSALVRSTLAPYACFSFDDAAADQFALIRHALDVVGLPIGPLDMMIAAICLTRGCTVVTSNTSEFSRVPGLTVEN